MVLVGRLLALAATIILLAIAVDLAASNTGQVTVNLWTLNAQIELPLWLLILACFVSGLVLGGVAMLPPLVRAAWQKRALQTRIRKLEASAAPEAGDGTPKLPGA